MPAHPLPFSGSLLGRQVAWKLSIEEMIAWSLLVTVTLLTRLMYVGNPPLNVEESRRALEAWTLLREARVAYDGSPILTNLTSLVFTLFGDGDLQARLIPALCGALLVLSPVLLRPLIGGWWALMAALCLAASTTLLTASRSVSPAVPAVLCLAASTIGAWRFGASHEPRWLIVTVVAAFIGVGLDTSFVVGLVGVALSYAIAEGDIFGRLSWWKPASIHGRRALAIGLGVAALLNTRLLMNPNGIQAGLIDPLWRWTTEISRGAGLTAPLLVVLLDGAILILALIGLLEYSRRPREVRFLGTWLLVSLTLTSLMRMPDARYLSYPVLPAALLAGFGLLHLVRWIVEHGSARTTVLGLVALVPVVTASIQINAGLRQNLSPWGSGGMVLVAGLLLVGLLAFNLLRGAQLGATFATWLLVLLALGGVASASRALEARGDDRGQLIEQTVVTPDMRFVREMALKWHRSTPDGPLPVDPTLRPVVGWAIRDIPSVRFDPGASASPFPRLLADPPVQVRPDTKTLRTVVGYAADWPTLSLQPGRIWRWMVNREPLVTLRPYAIVVVQPAGG
jgi:Dolichyl-phosphate-mannose-protein mannosyltransferase